MNAQHTQAPWEDGPVFQQDGRAIFFTDESRPGRWQRRLDVAGVFAQADARLIAAAPNLLAAAKKARAALTGPILVRDSVEYGDALAALDAAIVRAEGGR
jgi:hypothetical protein